MSGKRATKKPALRDSVVARPADWDKAVAAAYLRLIGQSQELSARGAGVGARTLKRWEASAFWPDACEEAADRWLSHATEKARRTFLRGIDSDDHPKSADPRLALTFLERVDHRLAPPAHRHEHGGAGGGPIEVAVTRQVVPAATNRVAAHVNGRNGDGSP